MPRSSEAALAGLPFPTGFVTLPPHTEATDPSDRDSRKLTYVTCHSAKGSQWVTVMTMSVTSFTDTNTHTHMHTHTHTPPPHTHTHNSFSLSCTHTQKHWYPMCQSVSLASIWTVLWWTVALQFVWPQDVYDIEGMAIYTHSVSQKAPAHTHTLTLAHAHTHTHTHTHTRTHSHSRTYAHTHTHAHAHTCVPHAHTHTHVHTHTQIQTICLEEHSHTLYSKLWTQYHILSL